MLWGRSSALLACRRQTWWDWLLLAALLEDEIPADLADVAQLLPEGLLLGVVVHRVGRVLTIHEILLGHELLIPQNRGFVNRLTL